MNITEFSNQFDIHYNSIAGMSAPNLDAYEKSVYLTKAQIEIIKDYYDPQSNRKQKGFEASEKRRIDLKELVIDHTSNTIITNNDNINSNSKFFVIPNDVFLIVYESAKVVSNQSCLNNKEIEVIPKTHDEYNVEIKNPFKRPNNDKVWRLNISKQNSQKVVELVSNLNISNYKFRYIKFPKPIIIDNLNTVFPGEGLSINGFTNIQECELDSGIHEEILDRAVILALADYKPTNLETKIQLEQRNE